MSMPSSRWPYGPAHEQPPRDWIPKRSLRSATTKLWWRYRPSWRIVNDTIDSRGSAGLPRIPIDGSAAQAAIARPDERLLALADRLAADALLELEREPARIDSTMAGVPPSSRCSGSARYTCSSGFTYATVPPPGAVGHAVAEQLAPRDEHAGRAGAADELVRREHDRVLVVELGVRPGPMRLHLDLDVRPGGGEVPERERAVAVEQHGDRAGVGQDAGHVRRRRERPDPQARSRGVSTSARSRPRQVDAPVRVLADRDHVGDGLAPRQLVAVVLVRPDEDQRSLVERDVRAQARSGRRGRRGCAEFEDVDELVDRRRSSPSRRR